MNGMEKKIKTVLPIEKCNLCHDFVNDAMIAVEVLLSWLLGILFNKVKTAVETVV